MMPIAEPNSENAPMARNSTPNQRPTIASIRCASIRRNETLFGRSGSPKSVECASIDVNAIVMIVTSTKLKTCSTFAKRHQLRHRAMLAGVVSKM